MIIISQIIFSFGYLVAIEASQIPMQRIQVTFITSSRRLISSRDSLGARSSKKFGTGSYHWMTPNDGTDWTQPNNNDRIKSKMDSLITRSISRAVSTITNTNPACPTEENGGDIPKQTVEDMMDAVVDRVSDPIHDSSINTSPKPSGFRDKRSYLNNPAVTPTALGHSLWMEVIEPYQDIVIDATAGNGKDSLILSKMLFPPDFKKPTNRNPVHDDKTPKLISIDIQQLACENTLSLLEEHLDSDILKNNVQVLHQSHAPMPSLRKESVGLICYNLGYLPGGCKEAQTQMTTTIYSLADSALLIRPGGLLSVLSYPGNGWREHCAVSYFMEGLAMFTSREKDGWIGFVDSIPFDNDLEKLHANTFAVDNDELSLDNNATVREAVKLALDRVKTNGFEMQTWRVFEHRPLGRPLSPILISGMRIK